MTKFYIYTRILDLTTANSYLPIWQGISDQHGISLSEAIFQSGLLGKK
jgi:hypothetical protein